MGRQTLSRDNYLSLPSLVRRRVSGVPPWRNGQSSGHMIEAGYVICFIICRRMCILLKYIICLPLLFILFLRQGLSSLIQSDSLARRTSSS